MAQFSWVIVVLQYDPAAHGAFEREPSGQYEPVVQLVIEEGFEQNDPAGHLVSVVDDAGQ